MVTCDAQRPLAHAPAIARAWTLLFLYGVLVALASLYAIVHGHLFDQDFAEAVAGNGWAWAQALFPATVERPVAAAVRLLGGTGIVASILVMAIAATAYRRGERWAWYAMWVLPLYATIDLATLYGYDALTATSAAWDAALIVLALLGLLLPYRAFFEDENAGHAAERPRTPAMASGEGA